MTETPLMSPDRLVSTLKSNFEDAA